MNRVSRLTWAIVLLLLVAGGLLPFYRLGERDLWSSHEARAAMDARSLLDPFPGQPTGLPYLDDGQPELQKPPTFYWLVAGVARLRGNIVDGFSVRFPAALSAVSVALAVGLALVCWGRSFAGAVAALTLLSSIHFPWLARIGRIDMPLTLTVTLSALAFAQASRTGGRNRLAWLLAAYLCSALGVLLKGPVGLVLPLAVLVTWLLLQGRWPAFWELTFYRQIAREFHWIGGLLLVVLTVAPVYYWLESITAGQFGREFLWYHNLTRGLGGSRLREHPIWSHGAYFLLYFLPFSPLVLVGLFRFSWRRDPVALFALAWLIGIVMVLSVPRFKRADYLAPAYPGAAIFLGCLAEHCRVSRRGVVAISALALAGWAIQLAVLLPAEEKDRDYRYFADQVRRLAPPPMPVTFFRTEAHALAFHVGRPLVRFVEWEILEARLLQPGVHCVVLPPEALPEARRRLARFCLEEVCRNTDRTGRHERPLVLVRVRSGEPHAVAPAAAADLPRTD